VISPETMLMEQFPRPYQGSHLSLCKCSHQIFAELAFSMLFRPFISPSLSMRNTQNLNMVIDLDSQFRINTTKFRQKMIVWYQDSVLCGGYLTCRQGVSRSKRHWFSFYFCVVLTRLYLISHAFQFTFGEPAHRSNPGRNWRNHYPPRAVSHIGWLPLCLDMTTLQTLLLPYNVFSRILEDNQLEGPLPWSLGNLKNLRIMWISFQKALSTYYHLLFSYI